MCILAILFISPAHSSFAQNVPNRETPVRDIKYNYAPGLGEIMAATQMRHSKLWFAGEAGNWQLAKYELFELKEGFDDANAFHPDRSKPLQEFMTAPVEELKAAISKKNDIEFKRAFDNLTNSCNACHAATNFGFNRVIIPVTNPYTNQRF